MSSTATTRTYNEVNQSINAAGCVAKDLLCLVLQQSERPFEDMATSTPVKSVQVSAPGCRSSNCAFVL